MKFCTRVGVNRVEPAHLFIDNCRGHPGALLHVGKPALWLAPESGQRPVPKDSGSQRGPLHRVSDPPLQCLGPPPAVDVGGRRGGRQRHVRRRGRLRAAVLDGPCPPAPAALCAGPLPLRLLALAAVRQQVTSDSDGNGTLSLRNLPGAQHDLYLCSPSLQGCSGSPPPHLG
jgi:hypothetical protein